MSTLLSIIAALLLLSVLVTIHELGHYGAGRLLGFTILEFSVGMGPAIIKKTKNGIDYCIRAFLIGGMCRFYGEDQEVQDGRCFNAQPVWKRFIVILAGPMMNFIFAILVSVVTLMAYGNYVPEIYEVPDTSSPAYVAGLRPGDIITAVDGKTVRYYSETTDFIRAMPSESAVITVERGETEIDCVLTDSFDPELGHNYIGITITPVRKIFGFFESIGESFHYVGGLVRDTLGFFGTLFKGQVTSDQVAGPVGTIAYISEAVRYGFETVLRFAVIISISLAIFKVLPLPALDGGRLAFLVVEGIAGRPVNQRVEGTIHFVGLMALFALILFLTYNDIVNMIRGVI